MYSQRPDPGENEPILGAGRSSSDSVVDSWPRSPLDAPSQQDEHRDDTGGKKKTGFGRGTLRCGLVLLFVLSAPALVGLSLLFFSGVGVRDGGVVSGGQVDGEAVPVEIPLATAVPDVVDDAAHQADQQGEAVEDKNPVGNEHAGDGHVVNYTSLYIPPPEDFDLDPKEFAADSDPTIREYFFIITSGEGAPDGVNKSVLLINGQSPGPLIEARTGDTIRVRVQNRLRNETTSMHWHGINQQDSPWMDGVPGLTQCAIPPGETFSYEFRLHDQRGTFWYHSHSSAQYGDGLYGPLIIHDPDEKVPPVDDEKIIMVGDLYHRNGDDILVDYLGPSPPWGGMAGMEPPPDNIIINGRSTFNCSSPLLSRRSTEPAETTGQHEHGAMEGGHAMHGGAAVDHSAHTSSSHKSKGGKDRPHETLHCTGGTRYTTEVHPSRRTRLRLISHSSNMPYWFHVDNHTLEVVEVDGVEIEPIATSRVFMNPGQRYSVVLTANQTMGNYLMRASAAKSCFHITHGVSAESALALKSVGYLATGVLSYEGVDPAEPPIGVAWDLRRSFDRGGFGREPWTGECSDLPFRLAKPMRQQDAYEVGEGNSHSIVFRLATREGGVRSVINNTLYHPLVDDAVLWRVPDLDISRQAQLTASFEKRRLVFGKDQHVLVSPATGMGAQVVINSDHMMPHPWHLHGQNFQIVGWGKKRFGEGTTNWNFENPLRRDTVTVPGEAHVVIRYRTENPGIWALHCHVQWHAEGSMFVTVAHGLGTLRDMVQSLDTVENGGIRGQFCPSRIGHD